jgi:hypothetical protein
MHSIILTTRDISVPTTVVINGETFAKKAKQSVPAVEVQYDGMPVAIFYQENTKGSLLKVVEEYLSTHGYLSKWYKLRRDSGTDLGWDDSMMLDASDAVARCRALQAINPAL